MRTLLIATLLLLTAAAASSAQRLRMDVVYTGGQIVNGPLSVDLTALPASVDAFFLLNGTGAGTYGMADVLQSSLVFGDGSWNASDLAQFSATLVDVNFLDVVALTYETAEKDTPTVNGRIMRNFPLEIEGTDIASGQAFLYRYETSSQSLTLVPEPGSMALMTIAIVTMARRRRGRT